MTSVLWYSNETPDRGGQGGQRRQYFQIQSLVEAGYDVTVVSLAGDQDDSSIRSLTEVRRLPGLGRWAGAPPQRRRDHASGFLDAIRRIAWWSPTSSRGCTCGAAAALSLRRPQLLDLHNVFSAWHESQGQRRPSARWRRLELAAAREFDPVSVCLERNARVSTSTAAMPSWSPTVSTRPSGRRAPSSPRPVMKLFGTGTGTRTATG